MSVTVVEVNFCSLCESRHADRVWDAVGNRIQKELYPRRRKGVGWGAGAPPIFFWRGQSPPIFLGWFLLTYNYKLLPKVLKGFALCQPPQYLCLSYTYVYFASEGRTCTWLHSALMSYVPDLKLGTRTEMYKFNVNQLLLAYKVFAFIIPSFVDYLMSVQFPCPFPPNPEVSSSDVCNITDYSSCIHMHSQVYICRRF